MEQHTHILVCSDSSSFPVTRTPWVKKPLFFTSLFLWLCDISVNADAVLNFLFGSCDFLVVLSQNSAFVPSAHISSTFNVVGGSVAVNISRVLMSEVSLSRIIIVRASEGSEVYKSALKRFGRLSGMFPRTVR